MSNIPEKYNRLGEGFDTFGLENKNTIIDYTVHEGASYADCSVYVCQTTDEISEKLGISGSLSIDAAAGNFNAKASYLSDLSRTSNAVTILVKAKRSWSAKIATAKFKDGPDASKVLTDTATLVGYAGDSYISWVETGLEYFASYQYVAATTEQRRQITAEASGSIGRGTKLSASLNADLQQIATKSNSTYTFCQTIGGADNVKLPDQDKVVEFATDLASKNSDVPILLRYETTSYSNLPGVPAGFEKVSNWRDAYLKPKWFPDSVKVLERKAKIAEAKIRAVIALYRFYGADHIDNNKLYLYADGCYNAGVIINKWKQKFDRGNGPIEQPQMDINPFQSPDINFDLRPGFSWGRLNNGDAWSDFDRNFIYSFGYPKTFKGRGGVVIDVLTTTYGFRDPRYPDDERRETTVSFSHGYASTESDEQKRAERRSHRGSEISIGGWLKPNDVQYIGLWKEQRDDWRDRISGIDIYVKDNPRSLQLGKGENPYEHAGTSPGQSFVGFQGRSSDAIDMLQPVYVQFQPPTWYPIQLE